jgi:hypothetical protein
MKAAQQKKIVDLGYVETLITSLLISQWQICSGMI